MICAAATAIRALAIITVATCQLSLSHCRSSWKRWTRAAIRRSRSMNFSSSSNAARNSGSHAPSSDAPASWFYSAFRSLKNLRKCSAFVCTLEVVRRSFCLKRTFTRSNRNKTLRYRALRWRKVAESGNEQLYKGMTSPKTESGNCSRMAVLIMNFCCRKWHILYLIHKNNYLSE